jgi:hypothetical protein
MGEEKMMKDQGMRLSELRERVIRGEYEVDSGAVAEAIVHRAWELALARAPLQTVLIAGQAAGLVSEDEPGRGL